MGGPAPSISKKKEVFFVSKAYYLDSIIYRRTDSGTVLLLTNYKQFQMKVNTTPQWWAFDPSILHWLTCFCWNGVILTSASEYPSRAKGALIC